MVAPAAVVGVVASRPARVGTTTPSAAPATSTPAPTTSPGATAWTLFSAADQLGMPLQTVA